MIIDAACPIVIDNGSYNCRAGFAGEDMPRAVFPTLTGHPRHNKSSKALTYIGNEVLTTESETVKLRHPIEDGFIKHWDDMELIWSHTFEHHLRVSVKEHPILLTEAPFNPKADREIMTQVMFEKFEVPAIYLAMQPVLSAYAFGRMTGVVLDCGYSMIRVAPIYDGYSLPHKIVRLDFGSRELTDYMRKLLASKSIILNVHDTESIKNKLCFVALDFNQEQKIESFTRSIERKYCLPDGQNIRISTERFTCPEALFQPAFIEREYCGIHQLLYNSILKCDEQIRKDFYQNIILSGGASMFDGIVHRLQKELSSIAPLSWNVDILNPRDGQLSAWKGGSLLASLSDFHSLWISKDEYDEYGPTIIHSKCF